MSAIRVDPAAIQNRDVKQLVQESIAGRSAKVAEIARRLYDKAAG